MKTTPLVTPKITIHVFDVITVFKSTSEKFLTPPSLTDLSCFYIIADKSKTRSAHMSLPIMKIATSMGAK